MNQKLVYKWGYERPRDLLEEDFWDRGHASEKVAKALDELSAFRCRLTHPDYATRLAASRTPIDGLLHWKEIPGYVIEKGLQDEHPEIQKNWYETSKAVRLSDQSLRHLLQHADTSVRAQLVDREDFQQMRARDSAPSPLSQLMAEIHERTKRFFGTSTHVTETATPPNPKV